jgi:L-2-hydroxyglutarate oxidase LhgO
MDADLTIIGAGVVGLAIASVLANDKLNLYILEKNESHGMGISSRNSEVIHAGIYYPPGSLKAELCVEGRKMLYDICKRNNIPHMKLGKLIISNTEKEMTKIEHLRHNAFKNGLFNISIVSHKQIARMEPNIKSLAALYCPETGIINVHSLMDYYLHNAKNKGVEIIYGTEVLEIESLVNGYKISTLNRDGDYFQFVTERVINAAGLQSDDISRMVGKDYRLHYCKGDYFSINNIKRGTVQRLIYPVPHENNVGLGVHLTLGLDGRMKLGPDATYIDRIENYAVDSEKRKSFYNAAVRFLPFIRREDIAPDMSGIRPKLQGESESFHDFVISEDLPGFVNLIGIESPGLTASPAIAEYVKKIIS